VFGSPSTGGNDVGGGTRRTHTARIRPVSRVTAKKETNSRSKASTDMENPIFSSIVFIVYVVLLLVALFVTPCNICGGA